MGRTEIIITILTSTREGEIKTMSKPKVTQEGSGKIKLNKTTNDLEYYLEQLEDKFPNVIPNKSISKEEMDVKVGEQNVIRYLYALLDKHQQ